MTKEQPVTTYIRTPRLRWWWRWVAFWLGVTGLIWVIGWLFSGWRTLFRP